MSAWQNVNFHTNSASQASQSMYNQGQPTSLTSNALHTFQPASHAYPQQAVQLDPYTRAQSIMHQQHQNYQRDTPFQYTYPQNFQQMNKSMPQQRTQDFFYPHASQFQAYKDIQPQVYQQTFQGAQAYHDMSLQQPVLQPVLQPTQQIYPQYSSQPALQPAIQQAYPDKQAYPEMSEFSHFQPAKYTQQAPSVSATPSMPSYADEIAQYKGKSASEIGQLMSSSAGRNAGINQKEQSLLNDKTKNFLEEYSKESFDVNDEYTYIEGTSEEQSAWKNMSAANFEMERDRLFGGRK